MSWISAIAVYVVIWWVVLFAVLPWGVRVPEKTEPGFATSAPEQPRLWTKAAVTSGIAAVLWLITYLVVSSDLVSFR